MWWADVDLTEPEELTGAASLVFAGVPMTGTIVSGGALDGRAAYRIVGGHGGWGKELAAKPYASDGGIQTSLVIGDAARDAGETVEGAPTTRLGPHYARHAGTASESLNLLAPRAWRVDFDGVTRFGKRPTTDYTGDAPRTRRDRGVGVVELVTDDIAGLLPGVTVDGSSPTTDVEYDLDAKRLTVRLWASAHTSRRLEAQRRIIAGLFPQMRYQGAFEFRVVSQTGERLNVQPVRSATGLPMLSRVPVRPGMAGLKAKVLPGALVVVQFLDNDPSRPVVTNFDAPDAPGYHPLFLTLGQEPALGVARMTDPVQAGPFAGVIVLGSTRILSGM